MLIKFLVQVLRFLSLRFLPPLSLNYILYRNSAYKKKNSRQLILWRNIVTPAAVDFLNLIFQSCEPHLNYFGVEQVFQNMNK